MLSGVLSDPSMEEAGSLMISQLKINAIELFHCLPGNGDPQECGPFLGGTPRARHRGSE